MGRPVSPQKCEGVSIEPPTQNPPVPHLGAPLGLRSAVILWPASRRPHVLPTNHRGVRMKHENWFVAILPYLSLGIGGTAASYVFDWPM